MQHSFSSGPCAPVAGKPLHVIVDRPWVNGLMDDLGQLHLLLLLQVIAKGMQSPEYQSHPGSGVSLVLCVR